MVRWNSCPHSRDSRGLRPAGGARGGPTTSGVGVAVALWLRQAWVSAAAPAPLRERGPPPCRLARFCHPTTVLSLAAHSEGGADQKSTHSNTRPGIRERAALAHAGFALQQKLGPAFEVAVSEALEPAEDVVVRVIHRGRSVHRKACRRHDDMRVEGLAANRSAHPTLPAGRGEGFRLRGASRRAATISPARATRCSWRRLD